MIRKQLLPVNYVIDDDHCYVIFRFNIGKQNTLNTAESFVVLNMKYGN